MVDPQIILRISQRFSTRVAPQNIARGKSAKEIIIRPAIQSRVAGATGERIHSRVTEKPKNDRKY